MYVLVCAHYYHRHRNSLQVSTHALYVCIHARREEGLARQTSAHVCGIHRSVMVITCKITIPRISHFAHAQKIVRSEDVGV